MSAIQSSKNKSLSKVSAVLFQGGVRSALHGSVVCAALLTLGPLAGCQPSGTVTPGEMVQIWSCEFWMGTELGGPGDEFPPHVVQLDSYQIGECEVTNREYAEFLNSATDLGWVLPGGSAFVHYQRALDMESSFCQIGYLDGEYYVKSRDGRSMANHPVVEVSWYGAAAYCDWLNHREGWAPSYYTGSGDWEWDCSGGYHLPTEAQWERAAAWDGSRHLDYGTGIDYIGCGMANYRDSDTYCNPSGLSSFPYTSPAGHYANPDPEFDFKSPAGCYDMSGNVREWCNDWYDYNYYSSSPTSNPCGPPPDSQRVVRGGSWYSRESSCRSANRDAMDPSTMDHRTGFRVAKW